ncbi:membrane protein insertion efficiency factor YidD [Patescibacteria group bacterium]|nr:membrane protein insertion efficiency factor YidD [Patescibacteria group bacterium]MCL5010186.1 membrane protein insertion efficiency factor YidD [Patescibacteria group bacterium]
MKIIALVFISFYQASVSPLIKQITGTQAACRFDPSCSVYAKKTIEKHGFLKGTYLSFLRIMSCQPFYKQK